MALIMFDSKHLHISIQVGILETYKPDRTMKKIYEDVENLRNKTSEKMIKLFGEVSTDEAREKIKTDDNLRKEWQEYLVNEYNKDVIAIINSIREKNKKICPGYEKTLEAKK